MLSQAQAQWLIAFMQNLPGSEQQYIDATEAQRTQAAHGMNVQQQHVGFYEGEPAYFEEPYGYEEA